MAEARYKEGKITENDLNDAKYALDAKKLMCRELKNLKTAELELKRLLSLELDDKDLKLMKNLHWQSGRM